MVLLLLFCVNQSCYYQTKIPNIHKHEQCEEQFNKKMYSSRKSSIKLMIQDELTMLAAQESFDYWVIIIDITNLYIAGSESYNICLKHTCS